MVDTEITPDETEKKKKKEVFIEKGENCSDKLLNHTDKKKKGDPKNHKKKYT